MLGEGGMGAVYQAVRLTDEALVAVKVMRSQHAVDATMAERFEREAEMGGRIQSPHVCAIHDFGRADDGTMYLVMELLRGQSLYRFMDEQIVLPWREAVRIAREMALGLAAVHEAGVIHRDLKPDNVFLCHDGRIKLLDFGIAKEWASGWEKGKVTGKPLTQTGTVVGTPLYMSPEAVTQSPLGPPTDLYALGAILFEMVTGRLLFEEEEAVILMGHQLRSKPDRIRAVRPDLDVPPELDTLVDQLLAKTPTKRPPSARSVLTELDRIEALRRSRAVVPFVPVSAKEMRRAAAQVPTEITGAADTTTPRGPSEPMPFDDTSFDEPTHLEPLPRGAAPTDPENEAAPAPALETSGQRAPALSSGPPRGWRAVGAMGAAAAVALGAAALWLRSSAPVATPPEHVVAPLPTPPDEPSHAGGTEPVLVTPSTISVTFDVTPASARISEGGVAITEDVLTLPRDGATREYLIEARGRVPQRVRVEATEDRTVRVVLRARPSGTGAGGGGGGSGDIAREF
jgi:serine/threonine protein kinase